MDHPLLVFVAYKSLKWLVVANVDRLHEKSAAGWDDDDLDTKGIDGTVTDPMKWML